MVTGSNVSLLRGTIGPNPAKSPGEHRNPWMFANGMVLSDGGHFDNLSLYELVPRRCRFIVVSDAGCDAEFAFEDLAVYEIFGLLARICRTAIDATLDWRPKPTGPGPKVWKLRDRDSGAPA
jgi:hypothetical protein